MSLYCGKAYLNKIISIIRYWIYGERVLKVADSDEATIDDVISNGDTGEEHTVQLIEAGVRGWFPRSAARRLSDIYCDSTVDSDSNKVKRKKKKTN